MRKFINKKINNYKRKRSRGIKTSLFYDNKREDKFKSRKKQLSLNLSGINNLKKYIKLKYLYMLLPILVVFIIAFFMFGPIFNVKDITIIKKDNITNIDISYKSVENIRGRNIFRIDRPKIKENIISYQQNIKDIDITQVGLNSLKITIESYMGEFDTTINGKNYVITSNGSLIQKNPSEELIDIAILNGRDKNSFIDYKIVFDSDDIKNMKYLINSLKENILGIEIKGINYFEIDRELHIKTGNDIILIFNLIGNLEDQIKNLVVFDKDHSKLSESDIIYLDLRVKNKIFSCKGEKNFQCALNLKYLYNYE